MLKQHGGIKWNATARCLMRRELGGEVIEQSDNFYVPSRIRELNNSTQTRDQLTGAHDAMIAQVPEKELQGSGWVLHRVLTVAVDIGRLVPLKQGSWFDLPRALMLKKAVVNVRNTDQQCFKWSVLSALFPAVKHADRVSKYAAHESELDWSGLSFPTPLDDIPKFERRNNVSINVYGWEGATHYVPGEDDFDTDAQQKFASWRAEKETRRKLPREQALKLYQTWGGKVTDTGGTLDLSVSNTMACCQNYGYLLQKSTLPPSAGQRHVDLLLIKSGTQTHFCWIKAFSRFAKQRSDHHKNAKHYCHYCLHGFPTAEKLKTHADNGCRQITEARPLMPDGDKSLLQFENFEKQFKAPFVIYADFEALTTPVTKAVRDPSKSYTDAYQKHQPCGYCIYVVRADGGEKFKPIVYRGADTVHQFIVKIKEVEEQLMKSIKAVVPMVMTEEDESNFQTAETCSMCQKPLEQDRVRDHDHLTGCFRGAAHSVCNLEEGKKRTRRFTIPVFFHNLKGYDGHLIVSEIGKHTSRLSAIPQNYEKMISFSFSHLRFLDSAAFLAASLDTLVSNLYQEGEGRGKFHHSLKHCPHPQHLDMLLRKGVYPYDYMDDWARMAETALPPQAAFFNKLSDSDVSDDDYKHAQQVWNAFNCKTLGDYHDLYMLTDVLLLADVFESFRCTAIDYYELDPALYFTTPNFAWDAMLKKTGVTLELITDYDMYMMFEQGLRGGIAMITHRHAEANNPYMGESYDKEKEHSFISYLDANNLYGWAMSQPLPCGDFKWSEERDVNKLIEMYAENETAGCTVKCDISYPAELHDAHNDYPLAPERKLVTDSMLSPYATMTKDALKIGSDVCEKLVPNLLDKEGYVVDIRNLKYYCEQGLIVTKVHSVITFKQSLWMKSYIDFNTAKRKQAKNDFEKDFFKLMCNSCFGKTMENLRNRVDMKFVTSNSMWGGKSVKNDRTVERNIASPLYDGHIIYSEDLTAIKMKKKQLMLNKPIFAGMAILDLSKLHMYRFHYDVIKKKYGEKAILLFTDTDSLCYQIQTDDMYADMKRDGHLYDLSNFPKDSPFYDETNKKTLGCFKDECDGAAPGEFCGLRPKMYSLGGGSLPQEKKTGKGVQRGFLKKKVTHADFRRCLLSDKKADKQQLAKFCSIRSHKHHVSTVEISKVGLCCYDNKRYLLDDGITSYSYGHYMIA